VVVLPADVAFRQASFPMPFGVVRDKQMIDTVLRQVDVAGRPVVVNLRQAYLEAMRVGEKTTFGVDVGDSKPAAPFVSRVPNCKTAVGLAS